LNKKYKVGIIGAGAIVESGHIPVLKVLPGVSIEWIYDRDNSRSGLLSKMFQIPVLANKNVEAAIEDIDICLLTIPYGARREYIEMCAKRNKALYIEKPFAVSVKEHNECCSMFDASKLAVGFQRRYYQVVELLRNITASQPFGQLHSIVFNQGYFSIKGNKEFLSNASLSGGGIIIESAIHTLDQLLLITGSEAVTVKEVSSFQKNGIDYDSVFDTILLSKTNMIHVKAAVSTLRNLRNGVQLVFEHASVECNMSPGGKIDLFDNSGKRLDLNVALSGTPGSDSKHTNSITAAFYLFWSDFLVAISTQTPNRTSAVNSLLTSSWIEQIYTKINQAG